MGRVEIEQYGIYWIRLDPTEGNKIAKTRPCVVISPEDLNRGLNTVIIIPITSTIKDVPFRLKTEIRNRKASIAIDHIRSVSKNRLSSKIDQLSESEIINLKRILKEMLID